MSDPFIRTSQSRPNLGSQRSSSGQTGKSPATPSDSQVAEAYLRSSGPTGTREKLNSFLSKLETTWQLFNRSSTESAEGELPEGRLALLDDAETPTPETLKELRARFKQTAQNKPSKSGAQYLFRNSSDAKKNLQTPSKQNSPNPGPKDSPASDRNTPKPPPKSPEQQQSSSSKPAADHRQRQADKAGNQDSAAKAKEQPRAESRERSSQSSTKFEGPRVEKRPTTASNGGTSKGSVLGRKPGSSTPTRTPSSSQNSGLPKEQPTQQKTSQAPSQPPGQRRPQLLRRPGSPQGQATSKSFLGTAQSSAHMRSSDAAGRPGRVTETQTARQPVFSQSVARVHPKLQKRQISAQMPIHSSFLDECHEDGKRESGPIRLNWNSGKSVSRSVAQRMFAHRARLQLTRGGSGGQSLGNPIQMGAGPSQAALASARTDVSTRVAGAAIGSLLDDLYEEEEVENLDEETAVTSLGLILRLGGEFTYNHSTRVLDLALELADEVGIRDKQTRKEIKFGTMLRDVGEFDLLLQGNPDGEKRLKEFSGFLAGQDMLRAGLLHDIGKVKIPPEILYKPGKLTPEEYEIMKMHPIYGEEIVRPIHSLRYLCPTIRGHHERWDGKGYPDGLVGDKIPLAARIISVADVFDALAAERPYKRGMEVEKVTAILSEGRGTHFDPFLVDAFLEVLRRRYPG